ncbi:MAG TPA: DegV family protein [Gammaproteobacteria bacterium]|jgi:DegV family protein with EDD domain|nr:DegV family protein [Gammaproteobacteria bacterium]
MSVDNRIVLNPALFLKMIFTGGKQIIQNENKLNQLNVYPVPDGDTGSNMAALMRYVVAQKYPTENFGRLLTALADASLIGSCGNSGMILSAFFVGLSQLKSIAEKTTLTINEFIDCLASGVKQAHKAVAQPVEGTILTVMQAWLNACLEKRASCQDFGTLFRATVPAVENALSQTEFLLPTLKENHVVDAGAFGFTKLLLGMEKALHDPDGFDVNWEEHETFHQSHAHHVHHTELSPDAYQFCMETLLSGTHENLDVLHQKLDEFCDSVVLNQSPSHIKAHVHTTDLMRCTDLLENYGTIIHQKIDDIKIQWAVNEHRKHKVAIVTDSSADLPQHLYEEAQIHTIPNQVRLGEHSLLDRMTVNLSSLYKYAASGSGKPSTAAPAAANVSRYLHFLASHYDSIIIITVSSRLSSAHQLIKNQAEQVAHVTGVKIDVIDSLNLAAGHGLLVMKAVKLLDAGNNHEKIIQELNNARSKIRMYVAIDELKTMHESGRLSKLMHKIADWGHLKPVLSVDSSGQLAMSGLALGKQKSWKKISTILTKYIQSAKQYTLMISHTASTENVKAFINYLEKSVGAKINCVCETAPSIGVHAGRGTIAVALYEEEL